MTGCKRSGNIAERAKNQVEGERVLEKRGRRGGAERGAEWGAAERERSGERR